jgi:hypothetical protein
MWIEVNMSASKQDLNIALYDYRHWILMMAYLLFPLGRPKIGRLLAWCGRCTEMFSPCFYFSECLLLLRLCLPDGCSPEEFGKSSSCLAHPCFLSHPLFNLKSEGNALLHVHNSKATLLSTASCIALKYCVYRRGDFLLNMLLLPSWKWNAKYCNFRVK